MTYQFEGAGPAVIFAHDLSEQQFHQHLFGKRPIWQIRDRKGVEGIPDSDERDIHPTCTYCGSLLPRAFIEAMRIPGTAYSGSDWKYGWPHKFYVDIACEPYETLVSYRSLGGKIEEAQFSKRSVRHHKFYATHLKDHPELLDEWKRVCLPLLEVDFDVESDHTRAGTKLMWSGPRGIQCAGVVGGERRRYY